MLVYHIRAQVQIGTSAPFKFYSYWRVDSQILSLYSKENLRESEVNRILTILVELLFTVNLKPSLEYSILCNGPGCTSIMYIKITCNSIGKKSISCCYKKAWTGKFISNTKVDSIQCPMQSFCFVCHNI